MTTHPAWKEAVVYRNIRPGLRSPDSHGRPVHVIGVCVENIPDGDEAIASNQVETKRFHESSIVSTRLYDPIPRSMYSSIWDAVRDFRIYVAAIVAIFFEG